MRTSLYQETTTDDDDEDVLQSLDSLISTCLEQLSLANNVIARQHQEIGEERAERQEHLKMLTVFYERFVN